MTFLFSRCFTDISICPNGFSLSVWLYLRTPATGNPRSAFILNRGGETIGVNTGQISILHGSNSITVIFRDRIADILGSYWNSSAVTTPERQWFHLGVTWKRPQLKVYVNGEFRYGPYVQFYSAQGAYSPEEMYLGRPRDSESMYANAAIDELYIFDYEKTAAEIQELASPSEY